MKRETIERYIKYTDKEYPWILARAQKGGWEMEVLGNKGRDIRLSKENNPPIYLYFYDARLSMLDYWKH